MSEKHYLKDELYNQAQKDSTIFDFLQEGSLDGTWYLNLDTMEEWLSPRFWTTLGYDPATKEHSMEAWKDIVNKDDLAVMMQEFQKHLDDPNYPFKAIVRYEHSNGSTVWISCRGIAIRDDDGKPLRVLGAHTDVTEAKEAQRRINILEDEVAELKAFLTEFKDKVKTKEVTE